MAVEINPIALLVSFALALLAPTLTVYLLLAYRLERGFEEIREDLRAHAEGERDRIVEVASDLLGGGLGDAAAALAEPGSTGPLQEAESLPGSDAPEPDVTGSGARYLVVDDSTAVLRTVEKYLEQQGVDEDAILTAETASEGLELFRKHRPPVAVLDIELPDLDGHDIARQIRALEPQTHIVVISSLGDDDPRIRTVAEIAADRVEKPVEPTDLGALEAGESPRGSRDPDPESPRGADRP